MEELSQEEKIISFENKLRKEGIMFKGYGLIPKIVILDPTLSIEAKAIYAYLCAYAGSTDTAAVSRDKILHDLKISKKCYYNHLNTLKVKGLVSITIDKK